MVCLAGEPNWGGAGLRDFIVSFGGKTPEMVGGHEHRPRQKLTIRPDTPPAALLTFIGVDAQYFSAVLMPQRAQSGRRLVRRVVCPSAWARSIRSTGTSRNTSCRLVSVVAELKPGQTMTHRFRFFAGPKKPAILENKEYRLGELIYYGWPIFAAVAVPLTAILHFFYALVLELRAGDHPVDGVGARLHVPAEPQAGRRRPEDAVVAAGDQEAARRSTRATPRPGPRPSRNCSASTTTIR